MGLRRWTTACLWALALAVGCAGPEAPEFAVQAHNSLDSPILATPAIVGSTLYVRAGDQLYAIGSADDGP